MQCASVDNREDLDGLALIEAVTMVVSTSNVTVHMAGALAKETWVLLPLYTVAFRTNGWCMVSSLTLYRQPVLDDWDGVCASVKKI